MMQKPLRRNSCCPNSATNGWEERPPVHRTERGGHGGAGTVPSSGSHSTPQRPELAAKDARNTSDDKSQPSQLKDQKWAVLPDRKLQKTQSTPSSRQTTAPTL
ncbi:unnamed protein product [Rangifer tarandus platyrhynchus]|uniref:Uncharacterized protein n=1 Tax=Rangifer tarandus platyrhynchus TaxID=3082113 RepID=A0AC59Z3D2_RANTA